MLIRSQSRKRIFNFNKAGCVKICEINKKHRIYLQVIGIPDIEYVLGEYDYEYRALEILDEIQETYRQCKVVHSADHVYEMPAE